MIIIVLIDYRTEKQQIKRCTLSVVKCDFMDVCQLSPACCLTEQINIVVSKQNGPFNIFTLLFMLMDAWNFIAAAFIEFHQLMLRRVALAKIVKSSQFLTEEAAVQVLSSTDNYESALWNLVKYKIRKQKCTN